MGEGSARALAKGEHAYQALKRRITRLELEPGRLLHEPELMTELDLGRTPIREAIQRLTAEKLVVSRPRQTAFVAPILASELAEIVEARLVLEIPIARRAAERGATRERAQLASLGKSFRARVHAKDTGGTLAADAAIHALIASMGRNTFLADYSERLAFLSLRIVWLSIQNALREDAFARCHDALITTIGRGDAEGAAAAAEEHVALFQTRLGRLILSSPHGTGGARQVAPQAAD